MKRQRSMSGGSGTGRGAKPAGTLSEEDLDLWQRLAQMIEPIRKAKPRVPRTANATLEAETAATSGHAAGERSKPDGPALPPRRKRPVAPTATQPPPQPAAPPPLAPFERKRARRIAAGRIDIEARLDLHGARLDEAYGQFRAFLHRAAAKGCSTVLVVTGKGGSRTARADDFGYAPPERGVLRRNVPLWLEQPELRDLVASYTTAAIQHGGDGALYIHLRRRLRHKG